MSIMSKVPLETKYSLHSAGDGAVTDKTLDPTRQVYSKAYISSY